MSKHRAEIFARVRPILKESSEIGLIAGSERVAIQARRVGHPSSIVNNAAERITFPFYGVFGPSSAQNEVFDAAVYPTLKKALVNGYSAAVLAYGQSGSGKTYTMMGGGSYKTRGVMQRALGLVFSHIAEEAAAKRGQGVSHRVQVSFIQVYNEQAYDLLSDHAAAAAASAAGAAVKSYPIEEWPAIGMSEGKDGILHLSGLRVYEVPTEVDALRLLLRGHLARATNSTTLNAASSRSHALLQITITTSCPVHGEKLTRLHLVDLAGSERVGKAAHIPSHASRSGMGFFGIDRSKAMRVKEGVNINLSLHHLELCLIALISRNAAIENASKTSFFAPTDPKLKPRIDNRKDSHSDLDTPSNRNNANPPFALPHIPYRNSVLTSLLRDALGGACLPVILACLAPEVEHAAESISTCRFAVRAARLTARAIPSSVIASHALGTHTPQSGTPAAAVGQEAFPVGLSDATKRELQQSRMEAMELRSRMSALEDEIKALRRSAPPSLELQRPALISDIVRGNAELQHPIGSSFAHREGFSPYTGYPTNDTDDNSLDLAAMNSAHASSNSILRDNENSYSRIMPIFKDAPLSARSETRTNLSDGSKSILENEVLSAIYSHTNSDDFQKLRNRILSADSPQAALDFTISTMFRCIAALQEELLASTQEVCELQNQVFEYSNQVKEANEEIIQLKQKLSGQVRAEVAALSLVIENEARMLADLKKGDLNLSEITVSPVVGAASSSSLSQLVPAHRGHKNDRLSLQSSLEIDLEHNASESPSLNATGNTNEGDVTHEREQEEEIDRKRSNDFRNKEPVSLPDSILVALDNPTHEGPVKDDQSSIGSPKMDKHSILDNSEESLAIVQEHGLASSQKLSQLSPPVSLFTKPPFELDTSSVASDNNQKDDQRDKPIAEELVSIDQDALSITSDVASDILEGMSLSVFDVLPGTA